MTDRKSQEELERQIDENLRRVFNDQVQEELPDRFTRLLAQLKAGERPEGEPEA